MLISNMLKQNDLFIESPQLDVFCDFVSPLPVPSIYYYWCNNFYSQEATDYDIRKYAAQSPAFDFLKNPNEDIYTLDDGEDICP